MKRIFSLVLVSAAAAIFASGAWADDTATASGTPPATPQNAWKNSTELSYVDATGNTVLQTFGANETFDGTWGINALEIKGNALDSRNNTGQTAEQYGAGEKLSRTISPVLYDFEHAGWSRDRFAGIHDRYDATVGLGAHLIKSPTDELNAELGGGYEDELLIGSANRHFASGTADLKYTHTLSKTASFSQDAGYIYDFNDDRDYRIKTETALTTSISTHLSLKVSYVWRHAGLPPTGFVKDDTLTTIALLINY